jgi:hypothetical protein
MIPSSSSIVQPTAVQLKEIAAPMSRSTLAFSRATQVQINEGGAIGAYGSGVKLEIHDTEFVSNSAGNECGRAGGGIIIDDGAPVINDLTFDTIKQHSS